MDRESLDLTKLSFSEVVHFLLKEEKSSKFLSQRNYWYLLDLLASNEDSLNGLLVIFDRMDRDFNHAPDDKVSSLYSSLWFSVLRNVKFRLEIIDSRNVFFRNNFQNVVDTLNTYIKFSNQVLNETQNDIEDLANNLIQLGSAKPKKYLPELEIYRLFELGSVSKLKAFVNIFGMDVIKKESMGHSPIHLAKYGTADFFAECVFMGIKLNVRYFNSPYVWYEFADGRTQDYLEKLKVILNGDYISEREVTRTLSRANDESAKIMLKSWLIRNAANKAIVNRSKTVKPL